MTLRILPVILLLVALAGTTTTVPTSAQSNPTGEIINLVNQLRATRGLPAFQPNSALAAAAQNQANYMAANNIYSHTGAGGSTPYSRAVAAGYSGRVSENIVGGTNLTPRQGVIWWENSAVHYNTLISTQYTEVGVGFATGFGQNFYALVVGRPATSGEPPAASEPDNSTEPIVVTPIELSPPREDGSIVHVVQDGQALWSIAAYYEVDLDHLLLINGLNLGDFLQPGDEVFVRLAEGQLPPPTPTPPLTHVVQAGQNAWGIAAAYSLSLSDFLWLNSLPQEAILQPGDEVIVRLAEGQPPPPTPTPQLSHIVQTGEALWSIAARYGLTLEALQALNGLDNSAVIHSGDELLIREPDTPTPTPTTAAPATATSTPPSPTTTAAVKLTPTTAAIISDVQTTLTTPTVISEAVDQVSVEDSSDGWQMTLVGMAFLAMAAVAMVIIQRRRF